MKALALAAMVALASTAPMSVHAKDLGVMGETFAISEVDILQVLARKLAAAEKSGGLARMQREMAAAAVKRAERPRPVGGVRHTTQAKAWLFDPSFVVPEDHSDPYGRVFARKGEHINPLDRLPDFDRVLIFIDGDDPRQVDRGLKTLRRLGEHRVRVILTSGAPLELMRRHKVQLYFDQEGSLTRHFGITQVPAVVERQGRMMRVAEVTP